ncbi:hypothetical protein HPCPY1124_1656 [Helicobacter pylori CPY1124]|nr:hypothetical protein HPCPY1124_1656 [Helicobacter pylori CPY1124]
MSEYVRGIGQIFQYEYFFENHLSLKNYGFCQNLIVYWFFLKAC